MKRITLILLVCLGSLLMAQKNAYTQQHAKYKMSIDVDAANYTYQGTQQITYTNNSSDELKTLYFHLYWNAFHPGSMMDQRVQSQGMDADMKLAPKGVSKLSSIPKNEEGKQNIHWIKQNGRMLKFEIQESIMKVTLNEAMPANSQTKISMEWDAVIPKQIRRSGRQNREGVEMTMTQWYPKISEYDYDGWASFDYIGREFHAPFADFEVEIKIDPNYVVGAGGTLQNSDEVKGYTKAATPKLNENGKAVWKWQANNILDFAWAADPDFTVDTVNVLDGPQLYFVYQKSDKTPFWEPAKNYMQKFFQIMNARFGSYVYPSYAFVQGGDGGMEYGMCTIILGEARDLSGLIKLMSHEAAHSWFQQILATNESTSAWMDEGFTSYAETLTSYQLLPPPSKLPNPFIETIDTYVDFVKSGKEQPASWLSDHFDAGRSYSVASYIKGELFLVQLGYIMGEQKLAEVMKNYYSEWKLKHPNKRDFLHIAQNVSQMDLKWFEHYWINTTKTIDYAIKNVEYTPTQTIVTLSNNGGVPMPIDFSVLTKDNKIINYQIPVNLTRTWKIKDLYGDFTTLAYWPWTQKEYKFALPFSKAQISALGIDLSQRMADVNPQDNIVKVDEKAL